MNHGFQRFFMLASATLLTVSCSVETSRKNTLVSEKTKDGMIQSMGKEKDIKEHFAGGFSYKKSADGTMQVASDRRSSFEGNRYDANDSGEGDDLLSKKFDTKGYETSMAAVSRKAFDTKAWKDSKKLNEMTVETPEFIKNSEKFNNRKWEGGDASFATSTYDDSGKTWDGRNKSYETDMNENVIQKREAMADPPVYSLREYQIKTIDETRSMMGRTD